MKPTSPDEPDPRGHTRPTDGRDRSHDPAGAGAAVQGEKAPQEQRTQESEEARNQNATGGRSRAESGTP